jgi:hypothetical protein
MPHVVDSSVASTSSTDPSLLRRSWHVMTDMFTPFSQSALAKLPQTTRTFPPVSLFSSFSSVFKGTPRYLRADQIPDAEPDEHGDMPTVRDYHSITTAQNVRVPRKIATPVRVEGKVWFANERSASSSQLSARDVTNAHPCVQRGSRTSACLFSSARSPSRSSTPPRITSLAILHICTPLRAWASSCVVLSVALFGLQHPSRSTDTCFTSTASRRFVVETLGILVCFSCIVVVTCAKSLTPHRRRRWPRGHIRAAFLCHPCQLYHPRYVPIPSYGRPYSEYLTRVLCSS